MGFEFKNDREVINILSQIAPREAKNLARSTVHAVAGEVRNEIRRIAPDHPETKKGDIKRSTKSKRERMRGSVARSTVRIQTQKQSGRNRGFPYWLIQEYGNLRRQGVGRNAFVRPAVDRVAPDVPMLFRKNFGIKLEARLRRLRK